MASLRCRTIVLAGIVSVCAPCVVHGQPITLTEAVRTETEALIALSCDSRDEVDALVKKATDAGGRDAMPAQDHGFMYGRSFYDLDGHHWEVMWMDPKAVEAGPEAYMASQQK